MNCRITFVKESDLAVILHYYPATIFLLGFSLEQNQINESSICIGFICNYAVCRSIAVQYANRGTVGKNYSDRKKLFLTF